MKRALVAAALVTTASCATASPPADPPSDLLSAKRLPDKGAVKKPKPSHKPSVKPSPAAVPSPPAFRPRDIGGKDWRLLGTLDITAYCYTGSRTASGVWPQRGQVATISPIPFGTRLRIAGLGTYTVTDRIGWGSEVDIYYPSCADASAFGRHHLRVWREAA